VVAYHSIKLYKKHHHHHLNQFHINNNGLVSYSINAFHTKSWGCFLKSN